MSDNSINFELIKMAKEMLINQYIDKKTQNHNKWLVESEYLWKFKKTILPYPEFPPYPTENDIIRKAKALEEYVINDKKVVNSDIPKTSEIENINTQYQEQQPEKVVENDTEYVPISETYENEKPEEPDNKQKNIYSSILGLLSNKKKEQ